MQAELLTIRTESHPGYEIIRLEGEIDASTAKNLDSHIATVLESGPVSLIIDIAQVQYVSSAGIGIFIYFFGEATRLGRKLVLANPTPVVKEILTLLRLEEHIPICESEAEAVALLSQA